MRLSLVAMAMGLLTFACIGETSFIFQGKVPDGGDARVGTETVSVDGMGDVPDAHIVPDAPRVPDIVDVPDVGDVPHADAPLDTGDMPPPDVLSDQSDTSDASDASDTSDTSEVEAGEVPCQPQCEGKQCGPDGCDGTCGECDDDNPCTNDFCDEKTGLCVFEPVEDGDEVACDDGNPCTKDLCTSGACDNPLFPLAELADEIAGGLCLCKADEDCGPLNDDDLCNGTLFCATAPEGIVPGEQKVCQVDASTIKEGTYDDGLWCNGLETCEPATGNKVDGIPPELNDKIACTIDTCDEDNDVPVHTPDPSACDDNNACSENLCDLQTGCTYPPISCDDSSLCTNDGCDGLTGCFHTPVSCDDGVECTTSSCDPVKGCLHTPVDALCDDGNVCTADLCDTKGGCVFEPANEGGSCGVGFVCSAGDCSPEQCVPSCAGKNCGSDGCGGSCGECDDKNPCTDDSCSVQGQCVFDDNVLACDDGSVCTSVDTCSGGKCSGIPIECPDDGNMCTDGMCDPVKGCQNVPNNAGTCGAGKMCLLGECADVGQLGRLSVGGETTCLVKQDGTVWCWGYNPFGLVGPSAPPPWVVPKPTKKEGFASPVLGVAMGEYHACALLSGGTVSCWGHGLDGKLGNGKTDNQVTPVAVSGLSGAVGICAGDVHSCAVTGDGSAWCWGNGAKGQLGNAGNDSKSIPVKVVGLDSAGGITAVACGGRHSCALTKSGGVHCWGYNAYGQIGDASALDSNVAVGVPGLTNVTGIVAGQDHNCARTGDATIWCWGLHSNKQIGPLGVGSWTAVPAKVTGLTDSVFVAAGWKFCCAVRSDGTVRCWGQNNKGQLGSGSVGTDSYVALQVKGLAGAVVVDGGSKHACAMTGDGTVWCWGNNENGQLGMGYSTGLQQLPFPVPGFSGVAQVDAFNMHTCAIKTDKSLWCWGDGSKGQIGDGAYADRSSPVQVLSMTDVKQVATGYEHTCALGNDGKVHCWGNGTSGQLCNGTLTSSNSPVEVQGLSYVLELKCGGYHCCARNLNGVHCWGDGSDGQLGDGSSGVKNYKSTLVQPVGLPATVSLALGYRFSCAVLATGAVMCWGLGEEGQLGNGLTAMQTVPTATLLLKQAKLVGAGYYASYAVVSEDATVWGWGSDNNGQLGVPGAGDVLSPVFIPGLSGVLSVDGGGWHACALDGQGLVWCWGDDFYGEQGNGEQYGNLGTPTPVVEVAELGPAAGIALGQYHTCVLLQAGTLACWGHNGAGQLGIGALNWPTPVQVVGLP